MPFKPMLAGTLEPPFAVKYPVYASPKLDGMRAIVLEGELKSRSMKPIANPFVRNALSKMSLNGLDGELIVGSPTAKDAFRVTASAVNSQTGNPAAVFYVFDCIRSTMGFKFRYDQAVQLVAEHSALESVKLVAVPHVLVQNEEELLKLEVQWLEEGFEGVMLRSPYGPYKQGRSTVNEGHLLKLKRFVDGEATVVGMEELLHNENEAKTNELGRTERSSHKENMKPAGVMGKVNVVDCVSGVEFNIGTGFKWADRQELWNDQAKFVGRVLKYKSQHVGVKDKPRIPVFLGWRDPADMDAL